jgi:hypothetical protein
MASTLIRKDLTSTEDIMTRNGNISLEKDGMRNIIAMNLKLMIKEVKEKRKKKN